MSEQQSIGITPDIYDTDQASFGDSVQEQEAGIIDLPLSAYRLIERLDKNDGRWLTSYTDPETGVRVHELNENGVEAYERLASFAGRFNSLVGGIKAGLAGLKEDTRDFKHSVGEHLTPAALKYHSSNLTYNLEEAGHRLQASARSERWVRRALIASVLAGFSGAVIQVSQPDTSDAAEPISHHEYSMSEAALMRLRMGQSFEQARISNSGPGPLPNDDPTPTPEATPTPEIGASNLPQPKITEIHLPSLWNNIIRDNLPKPITIDPIEPTDPIPTEKPTDEPIPKPTDEPPFQIKLNIGDEMRTAPDSDRISVALEEPASREYLGQDEAPEGFICVSDPTAANGVAFVPIHEHADIPVEEQRPPNAECDIKAVSGVELHRVNLEDRETRPRLVILDNDIPIIGGPTSVVISLLPELGNPDGTFHEPAPGTEIHTGRGVQVVPQDEFRGGLHAYRQIDNEYIQFVEPGYYVFHGSQTSDLIPIPSDGVIRLQYPGPRASHVTIEHNAPPTDDAGTHAGPEIMGRVPIKKLPQDSPGIQYDERVFIGTRLPPNAQLDVHIDIEVEADHVADDNTGFTENKGFDDIADSTAEQIVGPERGVDISRINIDAGEATVDPLADIPGYGGMVGAGADEVTIRNLFWNEHDVPYPKGNKSLPPHPDEVVAAYKKHDIATTGFFDFRLTQKERDTLEDARRPSDRVALLRAFEAEKLERALSFTSPDGFLRFAPSWYSAQLNPISELYGGDVKAELVAWSEMAQQIQPGVKTSVFMPHYGLGEIEYCIPGSTPCFFPKDMAEFQSAAHIARVEFVALDGSQFGDMSIPFQKRIAALEAAVAALEPGTRIMLSHVGFTPFTPEGESLQYHDEILEMYYRLLLEGVPVDLNFNITGGFNNDFHSGELPFDRDTMRTDGLGIRPNRPVYDHIAERLGDGRIGLLRSDTVVALPQVDIPLLHKPINPVHSLLELGFFPRK